MYIVFIEFQTRYHDDQLVFLREDYNKIEKYCLLAYGLIAIPIFLGSQAAIIYC